MSASQSIIKQTGATTIATLAIQMVTFALLALAPFLLSTDTFARLSIAVAITMMANTFFEFGLNLASTKYYGETSEDGPFLAAFRLRLACIPFALLLWALAWIAKLAPEVGAGIFAGAVLNLWNGLRATDQARQDYWSFAKTSILYALLRFALGSAALLWTRDPVVVVLAAYAVPVLAGMASSSWPLVTGVFHKKVPPLGPMLRYSSYVYLNALVFVAIPYVPQLLIAKRLDTVATGAYGLIITFTAPIALLAYSLRSVLLPKMLGQDRRIEDRLWSARGVAVVGVLSVVGIFVGILIGLVLEQVYGSRYPEIFSNFAIYFACFSATATVGIYSLSIHTLSIPHFALWTSVAKVIALLAILPPLGNSLQAIVIATGSVMVIGEFALVALLIHAKRIAGQ